MDKQEEKFLQMTTAPVEKLICKLAVPTIISMLVTTFYNMADTYFVSKIDDVSATGAVGVVFSLMAVIQAIGFFFGHGSGNYISKMLGKQNYEEAEKMGANGFFFAFLFGILLTVSGLIFISPLAYLLGSTDTILPYAKDYLRYILLGAPFMTSALVLNNQIRFQGNAAYSMVGISCGAVLNIGLDPLFIFTLKMGTGGAALATVISQFVSFCVLLLGTTKGGNIHIRFKNFTPKPFYIKEILRGGTPSLCRQSIASVATICLNRCAGSIAGGGDFAIAAMSIVNRVTMFANSAVIGFGQGFQPVCGFNYGAGNNKRVKKAFFFCVKVAVVFLTAVSVLGFIFAPEIIGLFRKGDADVTLFGATALRYNCVTFFTVGFTVMCNMMMQNLGLVFKASYLALARQGLFFIPLILILPAFFGINGIFITQPICDALTFITAIPLTVSVIKKLSE